MIFEDVSRYGDIINLPHHSSSTHPRMSRLNRAAQFAPFAALSGHGEAIKETSRLTSEKIELSEEEKTELDRTFNLIQEMAKKQNKLQISCEHFVKDEKKDGGAYFITQGALKKIDRLNHSIILELYQEKELAEIKEIKIDNILSIALID